MRKDEGDTVTKMPRNTAPTARADAMAELLGYLDEHTRKAKNLEARGRPGEAKEVREIVDFISREIAESADPASLWRELATCERRAGEVEDAEAARRWQRRAREIENVIQRCEAEGAKNRAKDADFSFVKDIMGGDEGDSVLDN